MQLGVHGIDLCEHLFVAIVGVQAVTFTAKRERLLADGRRIEASLEDTALALYELESGVRVSHEISYTEVAGCDRFRLEIYAEFGTVWLRSERGSAALFAPLLTRTNDWIVPNLQREPFGAAHHRHWLAIVRGDDARDDTPEAGLPLWQSQSTSTSPRQSAVSSRSIGRASEEGTRHGAPQDRDPGCPALPL